MKNLIVIPFNVPWNWSTDYPNQTAFELSKKGNIVICYLWGNPQFLKDIFFSGKIPKLVSKHSKNIYLFNPIYLIPFGNLKFIENLNFSINMFLLKLFVEMISFVRDARRKIFWIFDPNLIFIFKKLNKKYFLLYDCVDFFSVGDIKNIDLTNRNEKYICRKADLVVANSHVLQNHLMQYRKGVALVPQGFRQDGFKVNRKKYVDLKLSGPVIGFVGGINDRLDLSILYPLIKNNRKWNFVLWGPVQEREKISESYWNKLQKILNLPNVTSGMSDDKSEIPGIVSQFDIGMIPYDISQNFNKFCYPMKLFEYFYVGIPVISTPIIELGYFKDLVFTGNNDKNWQRLIGEILWRSWPNLKKAKERKLAIENSWQNKVEAILTLLPTYV